LLYGACGGGGEVKITGKLCCDQANILIGFTGIILWGMAVNPETSMGDIEKYL
jgi:hypothetical protein